MVSEQTINGKKIYTCGVCNLSYWEEKRAKDCEAFCKKNRACSLDITKHSLKY